MMMYGMLLVRLQLKVFEETRAHSAMAKKVDTAYQSFLKECGGMMANFEINYVNQRNRVLDIS